MLNKSFIFCLFFIFIGCNNKDCCNDCDHNLDYFDNFESTFNADGFFINPLTQKPYFTRERGIGDESDERTIFSTDEQGMLTNIEHIFEGKHVYSYNLDSIIALWDKYDRFTDTCIKYDATDSKSFFDYFGNKGRPFFYNRFFYKPDGTYFNGEIVVQWSSQYLPPSKGKSKITFRNGVLFQIAEMRNDNTIVFPFDMNKIIFLQQQNGSLLERHIDPNSAFFPREFIFCTDSKCFFYHPIECFYMYKYDLPTD